MSIPSSRSLRPLLIGSLVVLSVACRRDDDRSNATDPANNSTSGTTRSTEMAPAPGTMQDLRPGSADLNSNERMPVAGRDEAIELGAGGKHGMGGSGGWGGSGGSHHQ
jgi:hypothetical protein